MLLKLPSKQSVIIQIRRDCCSYACKDDFKNCSWTSEKAKYSSPCDICPKDCLYCRNLHTYDVIWISMQFLPGNKPTGDHGTNH